MSVTAYTPLETLLLFQALRSEGVNSYSVFDRISDQLKSIPLIRSHPNYDSGRLSPDALRELYLWLLKEEVKSDLERQFERETLLPNGDLSPGSRKRKASSPSLPTVHDASEHSHLIPQLVTRLYARYREHAVREIREHERRYDALSQEIEEIEAGKWDERLQRQRTASATQSPRPSSAAHTLPAASKQETEKLSGSPPPTQKTIDGSVVKPFTKNKIDSLINHDPEPANGAVTHSRNSSNTTLPSLQEMAPQSPRFGIPATIPALIPTQVHGFSHSPPSNQQAQFAPQHAHPVPGSLASPQVQNSLSRPSSSPRTLPPPKGMQLPPPSPVQHIGSPNLQGPPLPQQHYPPPHQLSMTGSPANERLPLGYAQQVPLSSHYYQQQPYLERRTSYPPPHQYPGQDGHPRGYQFPPFSVESPGPQNGSAAQGYQQQQQPSHLLQQSPTYAQGPPSYQQHPATAPSTAPRLERPPNPRLVTDIINALATPPRGQRRPVWKSERQPTPVKVGTPVPRPDPEPLSPVLTRHEPPTRATRSTRNRSGNMSEQPEEFDSLPVPTRSRGRRLRERSPHSVVSSTADESHMTRSHSVSTITGQPTTSDDRPVSRGGNVKIEPSTPVGFVEDRDATHDLPSTGRMTRKRRGTLQSLPLPPPKRKRQQSSHIEDPAYSEETYGTPAPRSNTVVATRNFHKLSSTIMNDINSHKHASYFANAVRDRDAPGYSEIIKKPQNLKAVRAAVTAGGRAVVAAVEAMVQSPAAGVGGGGETTVELERSEELVPPRGIVNKAQLEKEVVRMFANAVLFNPGEDGMVRDTREMFEEVERMVGVWRES